LDIIESLSSVLETRRRNRLRPPISLKELEDALQEECYTVPLEAVQNFTRMTAAVLKTKNNATPC
jgi:hypothetical protein